MSADTGHLPTPVSPTAPAPSGGNGAPASGSSSAPAPAYAAARAGGGPHAPFPTATDLMGPPGWASTAPAASPTSSSSGSAPRAGSTLKEGQLILPQNPDQLLQMITSTPPTHVHLLIPMLDALAGGPILVQAERYERPRGARPPSPLLFRLNMGAISDPFVNAGSLGFLYSLTALLNTRNDARPTDILESAARFCQIADRYQLSLVPARVTEFAWSVLRAAQQHNRVDFTLAPLHMLLSAELQDTSVFTPVHAVFLEACLYARQFQTGVNSLDRIYVNALKGTSYLDVLTFHHHAGTLSATVGDFERATQFFTFAVAMPTTSLSAIQIACAKRAILCELLSTGRLIQFPKDTSNVVNRYLDKGMAEYFTLAKVFANKDWKSARDAANVQAFMEDCNFGLVKLIVGSITKRRILNLRQTYSRMTVADLAVKVGLMTSEGQDEVVAVIQAMMAAKQIRATITPAGGSTIITFVDVDDYVSPENVAKLKQAQQLSVWLHAELERGNRQIGLNKKWLTKQARFIENKDKGRTPETSRKGTFDDDIDPAPVRGVGSNLADMGF